ncbi:MAG: hypothetical protein ACXAB7_22040 [Candidatus Kariarchaeaceae archaeon]|jgi:hypothetical protein
MLSFEQVTKSVKLDIPDHRNLSLGAVLFLYLSFTRGFTYVAISFLVDDLGNNLTLFLGIIPMIIFGLFAHKQSFWISILPFSIVLWLVATYIEVLIIKLFLILIGFVFIYGLIYTILSVTSDGTTDFSVTVFWLVLFDQINRTINFGKDPLMGMEVLTVILISAIGIVLFVFLWSNRSTLNDNALVATAPKSFNYIGGFAFFMSLLAYFIFYANSGVLGINLGWYGALPLTTMSLINGVSIYLLILFKNTWEKYTDFIVPLASLGFIISIITFPWHGFYLIFWLIGTLSCFWLLIMSINMFGITRSKGFVAVILIGTLANMTILFFVLLTEAFWIYVLIGLLGSSLTTLAHYLQKWEGSN